MQNHSIIESLALDLHFAKHIHCDIYDKSHAVELDAEERLSNDKFNLRP